MTGTRNQLPPWEPWSMERRLAEITKEAQLRADNHGKAFRVYLVLGCYAINPASEALPMGTEIGIFRPRPAGAARPNPFED